MTEVNQTTAIALPEDRANALLSGGGFLNRIKLCQGLTKEVQKKLADSGDFLMGFGDGQENLGDKFQAVVGPMRPHALHLENSNEVKDESFDDLSELFKKIERRAKAGKGSWEEGESAMYGVDFLFWIPSVRKLGVFFFCKTNREVAKVLLGKTGQLIEMSSYLHEGKKNDWMKIEIKVLGEAKDVAPCPEKELADALELFGKGVGGGTDDAPTTARPR